MSLIHSVASLSLLWTLSTATPTAFVDNRPGQAFTLEQVAVPRAIPWSAPHDMRRTYLKYGVEPPKHLDEVIKNIEANNFAVGPGQTTIPVNPFKGDTEYLIKVKVGNHNLTLDPDTGSADLYVLIICNLSKALITM